MGDLEELAEKYGSFLIFDTETTGLQPETDEIIEFAAAVVTMSPYGLVVERQYDELIALSPEKELPPKITELTGITPMDLYSRGISKAKFCQDLAGLLKDHPLLMAYNAQFDLSFLFYTLRRDGDIGCLRGLDKLDLLTVYRDRRAYPHKLAAAIEAYGLSGKVQNSHRAIDDVLATVAVLEEMAREKDDFLKYVNLFGYNARYGISGKRIKTVRYAPQGYAPAGPIYEQDLTEGV